MASYFVVTCVIPEQARRTCRFEGRAIKVQVAIKVWACKEKELHSCQAAF